MMMMMMMTTMTTMMMTTTYDYFSKDLTHHLNSGCLAGMQSHSLLLFKCYECKFMLFSLMHWNRVLLTVLKEGAGNDL